MVKKKKCIQNAYSWLIGRDVQIHQVIHSTVNSFIRGEAKGSQHTSPLRNCEIHQTKNFRLVLWPDVVKISSRSRSLLHFRRIASTDCQYLTDDALATRRRRPKPRESTGNRRFFSHELSIVPHTNVNTTTSIQIKIRIHEALWGREDPANPTIQPEWFAQVDRSSRRNHFSPKKTVNRHLILIMNRQIARWWSTASRLARRVSDKLTRWEASSKSPSDRTIQSTSTHLETEIENDIQLQRRLTDRLWWTLITLAPQCPQSPG